MGGTPEDERRAIDLALQLHAAGFSTLFLVSTNAVREKANREMQKRLNPSRSGVHELTPRRIFLRSAGGPLMTILR